MAGTCTEDNANVSQLLEGFDALISKIDLLVETNRMLEQQIQEYTSPKKVASEGSRNTNEDPISSWRRDKSIAEGIEAWKRLKKLRATDASEKTASSANEQRHQVLEQDFTTKGAQGALQCPFAEKATSQRLRRFEGLQQRPSLLPTPPDFKEQLFNDPIAVEFHADTLGSPPTSVHGSAAKCPIRFLDDHSPEEIAKYFENHKHEIPRSHEICVRRYQSNSASIRQLDAKYGNLVNMIQGLGAKHQAMLPSGEEEEKSSILPNGRSSEKIEHWAETCADSGLPPASEQSVDEASETRTSHFERPLQEVRLGESPTRPWGIQVPINKQAAASADAHEMVSNEAQSIPAQSIPAPVQKSIPPATSIQSPARCPFRHDTPASPEQRTYSNRPDIPQAVSEANPMDRPPASKSSSSPNVVFNGPVFFGYPALDVTEMLKVLQGIGSPQG